MKRPPSTLTAEMLFAKKNFHMFVNRALEDFALPLHAHDFIEFAYVAEGKGFHHIEDEVHPVHKGQLFLIPVGVSHVFRPSSVDAAKQPLIVYNCVFTPLTIEFLSGIIADQEIEAYLQKLVHTEKPAWYGLEDRSGRIEPLLLRLHQEYKLVQAGSYTYLYTLLLQLIVETYRLLSEVSLGLWEQPGDTQIHFAKVLDYIEQNYRNSVNLADLSLRSQWSERQLQRLFKQYTGQTFRSYLQNLRIQKSCEQLRTTHLKISAIAENVGYKDVDSFLSVFKRIVGTTPHELRMHSRK